ncbi:MAG TPA: nuclear transport factor 2 family protein [Ferruginibacter sp.]|nr:nuclear transport factor 2 family protein [Ferruginibacter sp.]HRE63275.1 nuclear transport factor 2 family protein [Ferruginibacter sp.]
MYKKLFFAALLSALSLFSFSQKKDLNDVKFVLETFRLALISGDKNQLTALTSPALSYGHSSGIIENRDAFIESLSSGKSDYVSINISNETIELYKNTAIVRHNVQAEVNDNGKPGLLQIQVLLVFAKTNNGWILVARQAVKPPVAA